MRALVKLLMTVSAAALAAAGCSKARPLQAEPAARVSWEEDVASLFATNCNSCHSGASAAAGYRTTSYLEAIGPEGARVAVAGDPNSKLLQVLDPAKADATHQPVSNVFDTARAWVVDGRLSFFRSQVHPGGILDPENGSEFHGNVLRNENWNFAICQKCHGADFTGGAAGVSCTQCHTQAGGPTSCTTCHGQPPPTGAHNAHVTTAGLDCTECHVKPKAYNDPGHLTGPDGKAKDKATITFGALAASGTPRSGAPGWDGATCSNIYCHGVTLQDPKATSTTPTWTGTAACGSCHGLPPANHNAAWTSCIACHGRTVLSAGASPKLSPTFHANGTVEVGASGPTNCSSCHGNGQSAACAPGAPCGAPPRDLSGNQVETALGVGAHQAHLVGKQGWSGDIPCSACHVVPSDVNDPGHIDHALPATVTFSGLAKADSAAPAWDHASATCSATYCHGGGADLASDTAFKLRKPVWNLGSSQAYCGSCHGVPPSTPAHAGVQYPDCNRCHANTVTPNGGIIVNTASNGARTSAHINGVIDVTP